MGGSSWAVYPECVQTGIGGGVGGDLREAYQREKERTPHDWTVVRSGGRAMNKRNWKQAGLWARFLDRRVELRTLGGWIE